MFWINFANHLTQNLLTGATKKFEKLVSMFTLLVYGKFAKPGQNYILYTDRPHNAAFCGWAAYKGRGHSKLEDALNQQLTSHLALRFINRWRFYSPTSIVIALEQGADMSAQWLHVHFQKKAASVVHTDPTVWNRSRGTAASQTWEGGRTSSVFLFGWRF